VNVQPTVRTEEAKAFRSALQNQCVVGPDLSDFGSPHGVVPTSAQQLGQLSSHALVQIKTHDGSGCAEAGNFRVQHTMRRIIQNGLDIRPGQFRVTAENGIRRLALAKLIEHCSHRDPGSFNHWLAFANAWIDFNPVVHVRNTTRSA